MVRWGGVQYRLFEGIRSSVTIIVSRRWGERITQNALRSECCLHCHGPYTCFTFYVTV